MVTMRSRPKKLASSEIDLRNYYCVQLPLRRGAPIPANSETYIKRTEIKPSVTSLQKFAFLDTTNILRLDEEYL